MKRKYVNRLPKGAEVTGFNAYVENGEIIVNVELKEKFNPKDGDFLVSSKGCVFIYSDKEAELPSLYCCYCGEHRLHLSIRTTFSDNWTEKNGCRFATPEEKSAFLEKLESEAHLRWNAETKKLEPIRWRAEKGATYYYVDERGNVLACSDTHGCADDWRYFFRNYFKTRKAACPYAEKMKELFKNSKAE